MYMYIGRQPIYNAEYALVGYELLYRTGQENSVKINDADTATRSVLTHAVSHFGLAQLTNGLPAYINFTRNLLMDNFAYLMDPSEVVLEIPGSIHVDDALESKLSELHSAGYRLSLNSYDEKNGMLKFNRLSSLFDIIRMDVSKTNRLQLKENIRKLRGRYVRLLAEKVETEEQFEDVTKLNFSLFQGYFFERPVCLQQQFVFARTSYGQLLSAVMSPSVDFDIYLRIIRSDPVLTHLFLSFILPGTSHPKGVEDMQIQRGLASIGLHAFQHWIGLVTLRQNNVTATDDMAVEAYVRGLFLERLMEKSQMDVNPIQGFFMGILSLLDKVTATPLQDLMFGLLVNPDVRAALEGTADNAYARFLKYTILYEKGGANFGYTFPDLRLLIPDEGVLLIRSKCIMDADKDWDEMTQRPVRAAYQGTILRR